MYDELYKNLKKFASFCFFYYNDGGFSPGQPVNQASSTSNGSLRPHDQEQGMASSSIGMGAQDRAEREKFENELTRILKASDDAGIILRVIGSLAFQRFSGLRNPD